LIAVTLSPLNPSDQPGLPKWSCWLLYKQATCQAWEGSTTSKDPSKTGAKA
jgi:hypothetical protein